jgi:hypothetical protein
MFSHAKESSEIQALKKCKEKALIGLVDSKTESGLPEMLLKMQFLVSQGNASRSRVGGLATCSL